VGQSDIIRQIDRFLETEIEARALALAFSLGWIDRLAGCVAVARSELQRSARMPDAASTLLIQLLAGNEVVQGADEVSLSSGFRNALVHRDLLEAKLWFNNLVAPDVHELFGELLTDVPEFMARAKVFELFRYDRCLEVTPENLAATRRWVSYTTTLTKYEVPACLERLDLSGHFRMLDVGGNSGEFARLACAATPGLAATVFDLPVVCALGREHIAGSPEAGRIVFIEGDLRVDPLPPGHDLISFKSVLHDWPEDHVVQFLKKAAEGLAPGGRIVIFERAPIELRGERLAYSMIANLVFLPFFRGPDLYANRLQELGLVDLRIETIGLEMPFFLVTARKPE